MLADPVRGGTGLRDAVLKDVSLGDTARENTALVGTELADPALGTTAREDTAHVDTVLGPSGSLRLAATLLAGCWQVYSTVCIAYVPVPVQELDYVEYVDR
jgi:hypothetical protein